jgi:ribosome-binding protein aMBF1 (putative translation factor)
MVVGIMTPHDTIADIVRKGRDRAGWSIRQLGRRATISGSTISRLERGLLALGPTTLKKLVRTLPLETDEEVTLVAAAAQTSERLRHSFDVLLNNK